jgi:predicted ferric reductase
MTAVDLCAYVGLLAVFLATVNICIGLLIAVRYSPLRFWPHRRMNIFALHRSTGYLLLTSILVHPVILLFPSRNRFRVRDILFPIHSPVQPFENTIGAVGLYLIVIVILTSYCRLDLGRPLWKAFHYLVYVASIFVFVHSILTDPELRGVAIDPFDGEKIFVEVCLLVVLTTSLYAWRYRVRKYRQASLRNQQ